MTSPAPETTPQTASDIQLASTSQSNIVRILLSPSLALGLIIVLFVLFGLTQTDQFANMQTWINIFRNGSFIAITACFMTIVLVSGGLDLSVGSVLAAGAMTAGALTFNGYSIIIGLIAGVSVGAIVGLINGVIINYVGINAIIVTLGTLFAVRSLVVYISGGNPIGPLPDPFVELVAGQLFGIPYVIYYAVIIAILAYLILHTSAFGWSVRALGGNRDAARGVGIPTRRVSTVVYVLCGSSAALTGALLAGRLGASSPELGSGFELQVIAAAIIGGTSISGAIGTIPGTMLGALLLSVLGTGLVLLKVDPTLQDFVIGVVLVAAAGLDQLRRKQMFKTSARRARSQE